LDFDLIIVGGGLVGASLARAARGLSVALVARERRSPGASAPQDPFDARTYAISPGTRAFLEKLNVWQMLPQGRVAPVHAMRVFGDDGASALEFDAYRGGSPELAWIAEDAALQDALWRSLAGRDGLEIFAPAECERLEVDDERAILRLREGRSLEARLVVGADGARSFVREQAGVGVDEGSYGQTAVVANFACEKAHCNIAYQWFQGGPVLALLPLPGDHVSMVWSTAEANGERLLALDSEALCREVELATKRMLGRFDLVTAPRGFPLRRLRAHRLVAPRVALVGDAAHVIHPLAGQGANLGFGDVSELAAVLEAREPIRDPGDVALLRRYERARAEPVFAMRTAVDGLFRLFAAKSRTVALARNAGLNLTDRAPVLKNVLMRHAMG
jgi:ubiquinone biosynthesis UbiH/UbiF/VisC/COQ6 family hydroxylase